MLLLGDKGLELITESEELKLESYLDPVGIWTIGFGTTTLNGSPVTKGMIINEPVARALLNGKLRGILDLIEVNTRNLNQNQIDALASLIYNIGNTGFLQSTLLKYINSNKPITEDLFTRWNKGRVNGQLVELKGLTTRRKKEYALFIKEE